MLPPFKDRTTLYILDMSALEPKDSTYERQEAVLASRVRLRTSLQASSHLSRFLTRSLPSRFLWLVASRRAGVIQQRPDPFALTMPTCLLAAPRTASSKKVTLLVSFHFLERGTAASTDSSTSFRKPS